METNSVINSHLASIKEKEKHKDDIYAQIRKEIEEKYGNVLDDYTLPDGFPVSLVDESYVIDAHLQQDRLPFTNEQIQELIKMPKTAINESFNLYAEGKHVTGIFLLGKYNGRYTLFSLRIEKPQKYDDDFADFHIKLDAFVGGKVWFELLRIDTQGNDHPNYFKDGKAVESFDQVEIAPTPHIHITNQECQILAGNCKYSLAYSVNKLFDLQNVDNKLMFKTYLEKFIKYANVSIDLNKDITDDYHFSINKPLFDLEKVNYVETLEDLER